MRYKQNGGQGDVEIAAVPRFFQRSRLGDLFIILDRACNCFL